jgi:hypothetical protein
MKSFIPFTTACALLSFIFFTGCQKHIEQPTAQETKSQSSITTASACKPAIFGIYRGGSWTTIVQKWYAGEKIQYIKTHFSAGLAGALYHSEPILNIDWGEVTYEGDQVRVRDVAKGRLVFRATIDASGKPLASYLYNYVNDQNQTVFIDTSYYYYGGNVLNYIIQLYEYRSNNSPTGRGWEQYTFGYGTWGAGYSAKNEETVVNFTYGMSVNGTYNDYTLTTSFKMLEYLDLTKLFTNSTMNRITMTRQHGTYLPYTYFDRQYFNYSATGGLVGYYLTPLSPGVQDYYIGWECVPTVTGTAASARNSTIMTLDQFQKLYPAGK